LFSLFWVDVLLFLGDDLPRSSPMSYWWRASTGEQDNYANLAPIPAVVADTGENMQLVRFAGPSTYPEPAKPQP
jgi:hypothetical protein